MEFAVGMCFCVYPIPEMLLAPDRDMNIIDMTFRDIPYLIDLIFRCATVSWTRINIFKIPTFSHTLIL
jgi:hypothetical protein